MLRSSEHVSPVIDDEAGEGEETTVGLRALVGALNTLTAREGVQERLIPLVGDVRRELYVGVAQDDALELTEAGLVAETDAERLVELAGW